MASFAEFTKKKKKQSLTGNMSFGDYTETLLGIDLDDIAPVRTTTTPISTVSAPVKKEEEDKLDFFQKGSKIGDKKGFWNRVLDVPQAILGTGADAGVGVVKGVLGLGEGIKDLGQYGVAGAADFFGADKFADNVRKNAQKNTVEESFKGVDDYLDQYSVLGRTSDAITQGVGQVGAIILTGGIGSAGGLGAVGTTALTTGLMGASSAGSGMSEAYRGGATDAEATAYGISKGVIDAGSELIFGGLGKAVGAVGLSKGISSLDDVFARKLSGKISNQVAKNVVEFGVKASAEGFEEIVAGAGSAVAKKLTYMEEEELGKIIEDENLLEQFVVGTVTSGMIQSGYIPKTAQGSLKEANATGKDFITGYTQNEQAVLDEVVKKRVAEQETDEKKLTKKEIGEIESEVKTAFERGEIDIDTIESVVGGDLYTQYNDLVKESQEYEELYKTKDRDLSEEQRDRLAELKEKNKAKPYETELISLKERLAQEVDTKTQNDTFIRESYNEKGRRSKAFEADLTKYNEKEQEMVKKAVESGYLNDTKKTHDFVDLLAKLHSEKGVNFDFTTNEALKESGFAIEGKIINGLVEGNNIKLNINSQKALNTVVGHEITHVLEGTEFYNELQSVIEQYATTKGEYESRYKAIEKLYEGRFEGTEEDIQAKLKKELTADLVGDYLFTDSDFISNLSTTKPNVFKRIYDEIKYFLKIATAGSKEAKQLEQVKRAFDKAFKEGGTTATDTKYSLSEQPLEQRLSGDALLDAQDLIAEIEDVAEINPNGYVTLYHRTTPENAKKIMESGKMSAKEDGIFFSTKNDGDNSIGYGDGVVKVKIPVEKLLLDDIFSDEAHLRVPLKNRNATFDVSSYLVNENVQYSLSEDSEGHTLSNEQKEYFKDSKIVDENGQLKVMYHGSPAQFTVFDKKKAKSSGYYGRGFYFSESESHAGQYGSKYEVYLNIKKPMQEGTSDITKEQLKKFVKAVAENEDYGIENYGYDATVDSVTNSVYGKDDFAMIMDINATSIGDMVEAIQLFNEINGTNYDGIIVPTETVAFYPEQIKSVTNQKPTDNPDINLSLSDKSDIAPTGKYEVYGKDIALEQSTEAESIAPVAQTEAVQETPVIAPLQEVDEVLYSLEEEQQEKVAEIDSSVNEEESTEPTQSPKAKKDYDARMTNYQNALEGYKTAKNTIENAYDEAISKKEAEYNALKRKNTKKATNLLTQIENLKLRKSNNVTSLDSKIARVETIIGNMVENETKIRDNEKWERKKQRINDRFEHDKQQLREEYDKKKAEALAELEDRSTFISKKAFDLYNELKNLKKGVRASDELGYLLDFGYPWSELKTALLNTRAKPNSVVNRNSGIEAVVREAIGRDYDSRLEDVPFSIEEEYQNELKELESERDSELSALEESRARVKRSDYHRSIVDRIKNVFSSKGFDFDKVLENAKDKGTFSSVDNTPQRFIEKSLGYKEGQILNDLTVNKVAQNETEGIKWLNSFTDKKAGLLAKISKEYGIKPRSKESASAQMYAEGFWVDDDGKFIKYGDEELAKDYPDVKVQENIKKLAKDERIRKIYDETLEMINESRKRNLYPEIPRRNNYFLHFREMDDTFSRLGIPFNPNDIRLKDLPTDINGMTADLKPGQPYFASAKQRLGYKTTYDLVGGVERYLNSAKNQIYHIDDIQTLRALRNYIADTFGQAKGLESLDSMTEEEAIARIEEVFNSHLSTFAKFLNEEANVLAGKTSLTDRGLEGVIGRRGIQFLDTVNRQVGSNMVGANVSSALTNTVSMVQTIAKSNKGDAVKAFAQTVNNKLGSIFGKSDGFVENNPMMIRRKGIEKLTKTPWESITDKGYLLMSAIDSVSSEFVARTKFNELTRKGMSEQQAHIEADKWASRILGDRSLGQQPQLYNSKMLGLVTKFQLEVRNQLDSQFYDTIQEAKVSNEEIENGLARNVKTSAKVASTFFQLAVLQHLFGQAFESVAGYNPAFDIVEVLMQVFGLDDDEESEDTVLDNLEEGFLTLLGDLPYTSTLTGGRVPISSALPVEQFITGKDDYGNEKSRWDTIKETAPYYLMPTGYGQLKKTKQGLGMFSEEHPVAGSYTDSGNLRFPIEDTPANRVRSAVFGQYASENARDYFDNERMPLKEKQIAEFAELDIPIKDYWEYREGLKEHDTLEEQFDYIASLDLPVEKKNIMINNIVDRKEAVDLSNYEDFSDYEEFDFATKNAEKYGFLQSINVSYKEYSQSEESKEAYNWAYQNPEKYYVAKAVTDDLVEYRRYAKEMGSIEGDKDENGNTINGSVKQKKTAYINSLNLDYGQKIILYRSVFDSKEDKNTYNAEIVNYLSDRSDITYEEMVDILETLDMEVLPDGTVYW